jgi:SAM-dependent methyltransferase
LTGDAERTGDLDRAAEHWSERTLNPSARVTWGQVPTIRAHIGRLVAGRPIESPIVALFERAWAEHGLPKPIGRAVSIGSGTGHKELALLRAGYVDAWECFEISGARVTEGQARALEAGIGPDRLRLRREDALTAAVAPCDLVLWSHALHHMPDIRRALDWSLGLLRPGGVILVDDYVGPNRFQWSDAMLDAIEAARNCLDDRHLVVPEAPDKRFPRRLPRPDPAKVAAADPTESPASADILPALAEKLPGAVVIPLGGAVFMVGLSGILTNFTPADEPLLRALLLYDRELIRAGHTVLAHAIWRRPPALG